MLINRQRLFRIIFSSILLSNILLLLNFNPLYIGSIISCFTFLFVPGILFLLVLRIRTISLWEAAFYIVAASIAYLEFTGLAINLIFPLLRISSGPLALHPLLLGFDMSLIPYSLLALKRSGRLAVQIPKIKVSKLRLIPYMIPVSFIVLSILGAINLNNGGSNVLTMILLALIALYTFWLVVLYKLVPHDLFPFTIFCSSLALLFTTSLRSWYITGHDIQREYYVFKLTNFHNLWNMQFYRDAYNACLSITILPTVLTHFLMIPDAYIYKVIFQILFAVCPIIIFFILQKYSSKIFSFLSVFFFMSFPTFFNDMPMLGRQEIGFIFFGTVLYVMLVSNLSLTLRRILFVVFSASIIVSHYSTNYVAVVLFTLLFFLYKIGSTNRVRNILSMIFASRSQYIKNAFRDNPFINGWMIIALFALTFFWNTAFTQISNNVGTIGNKVVNSLFVSSKNDARSTDVSYSLFFSSKKSPKELLDDYLKDSAQALKDHNVGQFYASSLYAKYPTHSVEPEVLPLTFFGRVLSFVHFPVFQFQGLLRALAAASLQILVFMGIAGIVFFRLRKTFDVQYLLLCVAGVILLVLIIILPDLSAEYGILRLFAQLLFLLSLPIVVALSMVFSFLGEEKKIYAVGLVAVLFFLNLTGFISHITGEYYPTMTLDNAGSYYDSYYIKAQDIAGTGWFSKNRDKRAPVQSDLAGTMRLMTYGDIFAINQVLPPLILKNSYVYLPNSVIGEVDVSVNSDTMSVTSPEKFVSDNKNLIYNNGLTKIYK